MIELIGKQSPNREEEEVRQIKLLLASTNPKLLLIKT
jgi:hypothetical protein